jgi:hypothetical protein
MCSIGRIIRYNVAYLCAQPCYPAAWTIRGILQVAGSNTNYYQTFQDIDIMVVPCSYHVIKWEDRSRNRLHIFGHVHTPAPRLCGPSRHFERVIMAVLCLAYLFKSEGWAPNRLHIFGHVHTPVPQLPGWSGHLYKSLLAIFNLVGRVSPQLATHIWGCARPCYLAAWMVRAFL